MAAETEAAAPAVAMAAGALMGDCGGVRVSSRRSDRRTVAAGMFPTACALRSLSAWISASTTSSRTECRKILVSTMHVMSNCAATRTARTNVLDTHWTHTPGFGNGGLSRNMRLLFAAPSVLPCLAFLV